VFYGGVNDSESISGVAGFPHVYDHLREALAYESQEPGLYLGLARSRSRVAFLLHWLINQREPEALGPPLVPWRREPVPPEGDSHEEIARQLVQNARLTRAICAEYGVECLFVWQPWACSKRVLGPEESRWAQEWGCGPDLDVRDAYFEALGTLSDSVLDLSDAFVDVSEDVFVDNVHVDESGPWHAALAERIADRILSRE
jgi:hypothetical protein